MKRMVYASIVAAACLGISASAQQENTYVAFKMGVYNPTGDLDDQGFDDGINVDIAIGRYLSESLVLEGSLGYREVETKHSYDTPGFSSNTIRPGKVVVVPVVMSIKYIFDHESVHPYMQGGVGIYYLNDTDRGYAYGNNNDTRVTIGVHLGFGMDFDITENAFIGLEFKHAFTSKAKLFDGDIRENNSGTTITLNTGYRF